MRHSFLIKYGEIAIKGDNRKVFEDALTRRIKEAISRVEGDFYVRKRTGRIYVDCGTDGYDEDEVISALTKVFGVVGVCPVWLSEDRGQEGLSEDVIGFIKENYDTFDKTFKVESRRSRKNFPLNSMEINAYIGEKILEEFPGAAVDVHNPGEIINIEIREDIYIYSKVFKGPGGMPVGTAGKASFGWNRFSRGRIHDSKEGGIPSGRVL